MKPRHHLYLDDDLSRELDSAASNPGASKSAIVAKALRVYLRREGGRSDQEMICARLDKLEGRMKRLEHDNCVLVETVSLFLRTYVTMTIHLPIPDSAGLAKAHGRYDRLMSMVGEAVVKSEKKAGQREAGREATTGAQEPTLISKPMN